MQSCNGKGRIWQIPLGSCKTSVLQTILEPTWPICFQKWKLKERLPGICYSGLNELHGTVNTVMWDINKWCLATGVKELPQRWESMIELVGDYIERLLTHNVKTFDQFKEIKQLSLSIRWPSYTEKALSTKAYLQLSRHMRMYTFVKINVCLGLFRYVLGCDKCWSLSHPVKSYFFLTVPLQSSIVSFTFYHQYINNVFMFC